MASGLDCGALVVWMIEASGNIFLRVGPSARASLWMVHGFGDAGAAFGPLFESSLAARLQLFAPDLPGFGASPSAGGVCSLKGLGEALAALILRRAPAGPLILLGHSLGAPIAVEVAAQLGERVQALVSIEGNLIEADAYYSGRAVRFTEAREFKRMLCEQIWGAAQRDPGLRRYFGHLIRADAADLWNLGLSAHAAGLGETFAQAYARLHCPTLYLWSEASTPEPTRRYIQAHLTGQQRLEAGGHWLMEDVPEAVASAIEAFLEPGSR